MRWHVCNSSNNNDKPTNKQAKTATKNHQQIHSMHSNIKTGFPKLEDSLSVSSWDSSGTS